MTNWTKETSVSTSEWTKEVVLSPSSLWTVDPNLQIDLWAWLDELFNRMSDEDDNVIIFHTWDFYDSDTLWTKI